MALPARIVSGGQTGVDRAALDAALERGIPCGGYVPRGRLAEDGPLAARYPMTECESAGYPARTELNVLHSDATLILCDGAPSGGTKLTAELCRRHGKPCRVVQAKPLKDAVSAVKEFLKEAGPRVLNVAGPRESTRPGIYALALKIFLEALS